METADECARYNIKQAIDECVDHIIPIIYIKERTGSAYAFIKKVVEDMGYTVEKRDACIKRNVLSIDKDRIKCPVCVREINDVCFKTESGETIHEDCFINEIVGDIIADRK